MALSCACEKYYALSGSNYFRVYNLEQSCPVQAIQEQIPVPANITEDSKSKNENEEKNGESAEERIAAITFSDDGQYFAATNSAKILAVWETGSEWKLVGTRYIPRRASRLLITADNKQLLVADKTGDVYSFFLYDLAQPARTVLGHLSIILDLVLSSDGRYIITGDRDEKIRVTSLPDTYNIHSYCLGHKEFITSLVVLKSNPKYLLSGSGDGTIKLWDYWAGKLLASVDVVEDCGLVVRASDESNSTAVTKCVVHSELDVAAVILDSVPIVMLYSVSADPTNNGVALLSSARIELPAPPSDITMDARNRLWVVTSDPTLPVIVREIRTDGGNLQIQKPSDPQINRITEHVVENVNLVTGCPSRSSEYKCLYKQWYDNVSDYLQKKTERINKKQSQAATNTKSSTQQRKRHKLT